MIHTATKEKGINQHLREMPWGRKLYVPWDPADYNGQRGWWPEDKRGVVIDIPVEIIGDSCIGEDVGLRYWADPDIPSLLGTKDSTGITITRDAQRGGNNHVILRDLCISNDRGPVQEDGVGDGIAFLGDFVTYDNEFHNVSALYAGRHGLNLSPTAIGPGQPNFTCTTRIKHCTFYGARQNGVNILTAATTLHLEHVNTPNCGRYGLYVKDASTSRFDNIISEGCGKLFPADQVNAAGQMLENCQSCVIRPYLEVWANGPVKTALILKDCSSISIEPGVQYSWGIPGLTGIKLINCQRCVVFPQDCADLDVSVQGDSRCVGNVIYPQKKPVKGFNWDRNKKLW